jgi:para-nitrobenzyl esterase
VAKRVHCDDPGTAIACLRATSIHDLLEAQVAVGAMNARAFTPSVGSPSVPRQGAEAFASGQFLKVPMINGGNRDEMRLYVGYAVAAGQRVDKDTYPQLLASAYGAAGADVAAQYPLANYSSAPAALGTVESDFMEGGALNNCMYLQIAADASRQVPVFEYEFADRRAPPVMDDPGFELGAVHAAELPYFFPHISHNSKINGPDRRDVDSPAHLLNPNLDQLLAIRIEHVHGAGQTGIEAVDGAQDLERLLRILDALAPERRLVRPLGARCVARAGIPCCRYHRLII